MCTEPTTGSPECEWKHGCIGFVNSTHRTNAGVATTPLRHDAAVLARVNPALAPLAASRD